jgi:uncharacterized membrane protein
LVAVRCGHCSHRRLDDVALDVALLLLLLRYLGPVYFAEYLVRLLADVVQLCLVCLLPSVVQVEMLLIFVSSRDRGRTGRTRRRIGQ